VQCAGVEDVRESVMFAREHHLLVSIRGGGHGVTGNAVCNDGLVIDLSRMRSVRADPVTQTARGSGGATWGDFAAKPRRSGWHRPAGLSQRRASRD
jgi:FAD/FMN-containing dehydrogenase